MRNILSFSVLLLFASQMAGQSSPLVPFDAISTFNGVHSLTAPYEIASPYSGVGPVAIYNTAQVDFVAGTRIHLQPGFLAGNFSGNGYFHAQIGVAAPFEVVFIEPNAQFPSVGQHEKLEIGVSLPTVVQSQIDQFISTQYTSGMNPYDPEEISVEARFSNGNQTYITYGFYFLDFIRDRSTITAPNTVTPLIAAAWIEQSTAFPWRIRWAPPSTGLWSCTISVRLSNALSFAYEVANIQFNCVGSTNEGWLEKGQSNWNLRYSGTHKSFFALGQNIAWNDPWLYEGDPDVPANYHSSFYGTYPADPNAYQLYGGAGYLDVLNWTSNLADNGGNMARFVSRPLSYDFEWENLNNYHKGMTRAWELDQMFDMCESKNMKIFFCMEFHPAFGARSNEAVWDYNPYHLELPGIVFADDFLTDLDAQKFYKAKLRYFLSRWGYSTSLGIFELLSEMDGWDYTGSIAFDADLNAQSKQAFWHDEMLGYVKSLLAYRSILTSSCYTSPGWALQYPVFNGASLDITTYHAYRSERSTNLFKFEDYSNQQFFHKGTHILWPDKPTILDEMGIKFPNNIPDPGDFEGCSDINYHNSLWATAMMGGIGAGFNWWQWPNNSYRALNFPALNDFFGNIDFEANIFKDPDFWEDNSSQNHSLSLIETFYNRSANKNKIIGWVHNTTAYYANIDDECLDRNGDAVSQQTQPFPSDDDVSTNPVFLPGNTAFIINNVNNLASYTFDWYSTRAPGGIVSSENFTSGIFGNLTATWLIGSYDWGFKAYRPGNNFRLTGVIPIDTLLCNSDTIHAYGNHELDSLNNFQYYWDFGNGASSYERNPIVVYSFPGSYEVKLIVSDGGGWFDTLQQTVVKLNCQDTRIGLSKRTCGIAVYPNPFSRSLNVTLDSSWDETGIFILYSIDGRVVQYSSFDSRSEKLFSEITEVGCYFLLVRDAKHEEMIKVIQE